MNQSTLGYLILQSGAEQPDTQLVENGVDDRDGKVVSVSGLVQPRDDAGAEGESGREVVSQLRVGEVGNTGRKHLTNYLEYHHQTTSCQ